MPVFEYKGMTKSGKASNGIIDAESAKVARSKLRMQGVFPTEMHAQRKGQVTRGRGSNVEIDLSRYIQFISHKDVTILTRQLATLIGASVPMAESLGALVDQTEKARLKIILSEVKEMVNEGGTLADAMAKHPRVFDDLYVQMVRAGEKSGALDVVLKRLAEFRETQGKLRGKVISAMIYPILMSIVGTGILIGLFTFVVPQMRTMVGSLSNGKDTLPFISKLVFGVGDIMTSGWSCVLVLFVMIGIVGLRYWIKNGGAKSWDRFKLRIPVFGKLGRMVSVSRFCRTLSTLLKSGVPIVTALTIVKDVVGNLVVKDAVQRAADNILEGQSISVPLRRSGQFPPMVTHMIAIGERTGELEAMLTNVAEAYDSEVQTTVDAVTALIAPVMIIVLGGAVLVIALGLLLPLASLTQNFGT